MFFARQFFPFFNTLFLGAFNDNLFRNALVVMITYQMGYAPGKASALSFLAMALLMLPQFPFSAMAGAAADKIPQAKLFRLIKFAEIVLMVLTLAAFYFRSISLLLILLFLMGTQSAFFSPLKYAYVPRNLPDDLVRGNAYVSAGTYLAILSGTIGGNLMITLENGAVLTGAALVIFAVAGYFAARSVPQKAAPDADLKINWNCFTGMAAILKTVFCDFTMRHCVLGLSIFWMAGALYVSQLAGFCKEIIGADPKLVMAFTLLFSVGVAIGSCLCSLVRKRWNVLRLVAPALILMGIFTLDLYFASHSWERLGAGDQLSPVSDLIRVPAFWRFAGDLLALAACGGFYSVPLITLLQKTAPQNEIARAVAANNIVNAAMIGLGTICSAVLMGAGVLSVEGIFLLIGCVNFATALYLLPIRNKKI